MSSERPEDADPKLESANSPPAAPSSLRWKIAGRALTIGARPLVMGIVNVTPDSFSDGGRYVEAAAAVQHGLELAAQGADILDVGGESTRPGAAPVSASEEIRRVVSVIEGLATRSTVPLSVDTSKAEVARACLMAGASIVNDVTALADRNMAAAVQEFGAGLILMHMQGNPRTMQDDPRYGDVVADISQFFGERLRAACEMGMSAEQIVLDPGIGFGKRSAHNREIVSRLDEFQALGRPVCLGVSRKGFISHLVGERPVERRLAGWLGILCYALAHHSIQIARVHDVEETRDAMTSFRELECNQHDPRDAL